MTGLLAIMGLLAVAPPPLPSACVAEEARPMQADADYQHRAAAAADLRMLLKGAALLVPCAEATVRLRVAVMSPHGAGASWEQWRLVVVAETRPGAALVAFSGQGLQPDVAESRVAALVRAWLRRQP